MARKVEVFTAGCAVCNPVVDLVKSMTCESCDVTVYNIAEGCESWVCLTKIGEYGIKHLPAVVVDGKLLECCKGNEITKETLASAWIGNTDKV